MDTTFTSPLDHDRDLQLDELEERDLIRACATGDDGAFDILASHIAATTDRQVQAIRWDMERLTRLCGYSSVYDADVIENLEAVWVYAHAECRRRGLR